MALTREKLIRTIQRRLVKDLGKTTPEVRDLAENIVFDIDNIMEAADEGVDVRPIRFEDEPSTLPPSPSVMKPLPQAVPRPEGKSSLILPGDPDFKSQVPEGLMPKKVSAMAAPRSRVVATDRPRKVVEREWWSPEDLIHTLESNFPTEISFEPDGIGHPITVKRNIQNQAWAKTVAVEYKHPDVASEMGHNIGSEDASYNIALVARKVYTLFDQELDIEEGLQDVMRQLRSLYRKREKHMEPIMGPEVPLRMENAGGMEVEKSNFKPGWESVGQVVQGGADSSESSAFVVDGKVYHVPRPAGEFSKSIKAMNVADSGKTTKE